MNTLFEEFWKRDLIIPVLEISNIKQIMLQMKTGLKGYMLMHAILKTSGHRSAVRLVTFQKHLQPCKSLDD